MTDLGLRGRSAVVSGDETGLASALADALEAAGASVERVVGGARQATAADLLVHVTDGSEALLEPLLDALVAGGRGGAVLLAGTGEPLVEWVQRLAVQLAPHGIRVNGVAVSEGRGPLGSVAPEDAVGIAVALLSDVLAGPVTGVTVDVDGGARAQAMTELHEPSPYGAGEAHLDAARAAAWLLELLDDASGAGRMAGGGLPAREVTDALESGRAGFDCAAAGFPEPLLFVRYALTRAPYELVDDDAGTARIIPA